MADNFLIIVGAAGVAIILMIIISIIYNKKIVKKMQEYALAKGGTFSKKDIFNLSNKTKCFSGGFDKVIKNIVRIQQSGLFIYLFHYKEFGGGRKGMIDTACLIEGKMNIKDMLEVWTKFPLLSKLLGGKNQIDNIGSEEFNKKYQVISPNPAFASSFLDNSTQYLFIQHSNTKNWMLIFKLAENKVFVRSNSITLKSVEDWDYLINLGKTLWWRVYQLYAPRKGYKS